MLPRQPCCLSNKPLLLSEIGIPSGPMLARRSVEMEIWCILLHAHGFILFAGLLVYFEVVGIKSNISYRLGKHSATKLHLKPYPPVFTLSVKHRYEEI